ncbi:MAG: single-stranded DNA-binding protein [Cytophagaceae bacterium]|jgi:single-strand DNA-binding protein|nr:single-stranded DNA-binding protein [Cytophagaceae bacterium]
MAGINKAILVGNLGKDPEIRSLNDGRKVANFPLATTESYKNKNGERVDNTEWHNVVFYGPIAEVIEKYLRKGSQLYVEGKIRTRSYDDKDGNKKYITEIIGDQMTMLGGGNRTTTGAEAVGTAATVENGTYAASAAGDAADDLPF